MDESVGYEHSPNTISAIMDYVKSIQTRPILPSNLPEHPGYSFMDLINSPGSGYLIGGLQGPSQRIFIRPEEVKQMRSYGGSGKGFDELNYPTIAKLRMLFRSSDPVKFPEGTFMHEDEIKGMNLGHALWQAAQNWPNAKLIQLLGPGSK